MGLPIVCPRCDNVLSQSEQDNHLLCGSCGFYCNIAAVNYIYTDRRHSAQTVPQVQLAEPTLQLQLQASAQQKVLSRSLYTCSILELILLYFSDVTHMSMLEADRMLKTIA